MVVFTIFTIFKNVYLQKLFECISQNGEHQMENYFDLNKFVDTILKDVFEHHRDRRIVFSSFDPDCCIA